LDNLSDCGKTLPENTNLLTRDYSRIVCYAISQILASRPSPVELVSASLPTSSSCGYDPRGLLV